MKTKYKLVLGIIMLVSIMGVAQTSMEKQKLKAEAESFIKVYNSGNINQYRIFLETVIADTLVLENTLKRYMNTYNTIGHVQSKQLLYPSPTKVEIITQEDTFESWWKFTIMTDENQNFISRSVIPIPLPEVGLKTKKLSKGAIITKLDNYIVNKLGDNFSGNIFISKNGNVIYNKSFGKNQLGEPNIVATEFGLASAGKMFTAITILQLQDQKKISLEDSVIKFLPNLKNNKLHHITIAQLLTHTSGMGDFFESPMYQELSKNLNTSESFYPFIESDEPHFTPGQELRYSNTGFSLLGLIIEKVSGFTFQEYVKTHILEPLKMTHTTVGTGAGGGTSTIDDMVLFLKGANGGKILNAKSKNTLLSYTFDGHYGYGTEHHIIGNEHIIGHSGGFINECVELNLYPKTNQIVVILSNSNPPFGHFLSSKIKELLLYK